ncbi:uncharacterized protein PHACADRAFT_194188 [Phanerochaete carnosa HHB-10118-sp]|uniref:Uncharacterized protein n=1 Tax=Phanerochaete carnosa (strain HHB-10118-sp) TaxID=650164 RepID=K5WBJ6_PHACS|nr:uncharacterized protein PHACADRAFT_194188 [Phanerochaete carnosa HHB-10118-sp]EKM56595.1 hypothetical protein PHACADRAFT_194188 [Phanerochaete carnosa HHB-10118-sp]
MVATFEWSDLVEKALEDECKGLNFTKLVHIWKAMAHTRWHRAVCHKYVQNLEKSIQAEYFHKAHEWGDANVDEYRCHMLVIQYKKTFSDWSLGMPSSGMEEDFAREFGYREKYYTLASQCQRDFKDDEVLPADVDDWGNQIDEVHR